MPPGGGWDDLFGSDYEERITPPGVLVSAAYHKIVALVEKYKAK
jgi:hypothetical protein